MKNIILGLLFIISTTGFSQWRINGAVIEKLPRTISGQDSLLIEKKDSGYIYKMSLQEMKQLSGLNRLYNIINVLSLTSSTVDGQTVYFGTLPKAPVTSAGSSKIYIRQAGTIEAIEVYSYAVTAGSAEAWSLYIRKNNTTDYLIETVAQSSNERIFSNYTLSISVSPGDYLELKLVNPTWVVNPNNVSFGGYIAIQ